MRWLAAATAGLILAFGTTAKAAEISISCSALGKEHEICRRASTPGRRSRDIRSRSSRPPIPPPSASPCINSSSPPVRETSTCFRWMWCGPASWGSTSWT
jgi:capsular polysaccharide biosynthesis protein